MTTSTITLMNGVELPTIAVYGKIKSYQSLDRNVFEVRIPSTETTFDELRALFVKDNLAEIVLTETTTYDPIATEDGEIIVTEPTVNKFIHYNYSIVKELGLRENEGMFFVEIAQKTDLELSVENQARLLNALLTGEEN